MITSINYIITLIIHQLNQSVLPLYEEINKIDTMYDKDNSFLL